MSKIGIKINCPLEKVGLGIAYPSEPFDTVDNRYIFYEELETLLNATKDQMALYLTSSDPTERKFMELLIKKASNFTKQLEKTI